MEYTHITDLVSLLQALLVGVGMGVYYDVFRLRRRIFQFRWLSVALQDVIFWVTSAVAVFFVCVRWNGGYIRIYFVFPYSGKYGFCDSGYSNKFHKSHF